jgi:hypothetical protein
VNARRDWQACYLDQSVLGKPAYATIGSKAAHLLYFVIKNHPFADGNKRCAGLALSGLHASGVSRPPALGPPTLRSTAGSRSASPMLLQRASEPAPLASA